MEKTIAKEKEKSAELSKQADLTSKELSTQKQRNLELTEEIKASRKEVLEKQTSIEGLLRQLETSNHAFKILEHRFEIDTRKSAQELRMVPFLFFFLFSPLLLSSTFCSFHLCFFIFFLFCFLFCFVISITEHYLILLNFFIDLWAAGCYPLCGISSYPLPFSIQCHHFEGPKRETGSWREISLSNEGFFLSLRITWRHKNTPTFLFFLLT